MNRDDVIHLLQVIHGYDNRKIDAISIEAFSQSARRANWTLAAALDAVHDYYAFTPRGWVMPGDITERVRASRRQPAPVAELRALGAPPPASPERRAEVMRLVRRLAERKAVDNA
ncbi:hypothetical protein [Nocardia otitidiscaviarum]|uniref:hypothetical protein n=1 Tax=Nocardia otitidiscaviarum TaxID=1823 RepID=UPI0004A6B464|nr:hypothetical protein [Nocardia otitidiscaviarum]